MSDAPTEPGGFVGDIYYGDPDHTTLGTHRWNGSEWMALASEAEALTMLLGSAHARIADLERHLAEARGDWRRVVAAATGNQSATRCDACRDVGMIHCPEAFYGCSGMRDYTVEEVLSALKQLRAMIVEARDACNQARLAFAGCVSVDSALRKLDALT